MAAPLLELRGLCVQYASGQKPLKALDGISISIERGQVTALVGESGCGKTSLALAVLGLLPFSGRTVSGDILFDGQDISSLRDEDLRRIRGREVSMIFQDPVSGLNPTLKIGEQVEESIRAHLAVNKGEAKALALEALARAGLPDPEVVAKRYPFQLSGGMCQRVIIAMATALTPKLLIADEPTSSLDATVQAAILDELDRLRKERGVAILLITHDLGVVAQIADEIAVMYAGRIVEQGSTRDVLRAPRHPYTWALLQALPRVDQAGRGLRPIKGTPPDLAELTRECAFLPRCPKAVSACRTEAAPALSDVGRGQFAACYNPVVHVMDPAAAGR
jgi:oligopeptide/dipeptide ABC transporter ATP-binding protein